MCSDDWFFTSCHLGNWLHAWLEDQFDELLKLYVLCWDVSVSRHWTSCHGSLLRAGWHWLLPRYHLRIEIACLGGCMFRHTVDLADFWMSSWWYNLRVENIFNIVSFLNHWRPFSLFIRVLHFNFSCFLSRMFFWTFQRHDSSHWFLTLCLCNEGVTIPLLTSNSLTLCKGIIDAKRRWLVKLGNKVIFLV